ncbi:MAG: hypothetical protein KA742_15505 [Pseudoxanthomonas sp.]|nr:hypothetical protein [Pseudoxanthomonas sp.]
MWIFLSDSFLSIVDKGDPSGATLLVRARRRGDIEAVFPGAEVVEGAGTDYRYHARIDRDQVALAMAEQVRAIRYPNYKGAVHDEALHNACVSVWSAMARLQDGKPRR